MNDNSSNAPVSVLLFSMLLASLLSGCVPLATGVITYEAAVSHQEAAAYTDYFFATQAKNKLNQETGQPMLPILARPKWLKQFHQPRLDYAEYYSWYVERGIAPESLIPFESWNETEHQKFRGAQRAELGRNAGGQQRNR